MEVGPYRGNRLGRLGLGINRNTWNFGRQIGTLAKRGIKSYFSNKKRKASSSTRPAKRARTTKFGYQIPTGGGDSKSTFYLENPLEGKLPPVASELPPSVLVNNEAGRAESDVGKQNFILCGDYFTDTDVNSGFTLVNSLNSTKMLLRSVRGETLITNQENVNGRFTIYDVLCRKDTDATVTDPLTAITTGYADAQGGAASNYLIPGTSVYSNSRFTEYFKVLQKTEVILSPGACHRHQVTYKPNKYFSHQCSARIAGSGIGGLTLYTLVQFHGSPINDVTTQTQVSLSHIAMDYVQLEEYKFAYVHAGSMAMSATNILPTAFTVAGNTMQDDGVELAANEA